MHRAVAFGLLTTLFLPSLASGETALTTPPLQPMRWYKGNTHTHTTSSDGDSSPQLVARWYRDAGYDFLVLSDHNKLTPVKALQERISGENLQKAKKPFLLIPGEEISDSAEEGERKGPIHMNALGTSRAVGRQGGKSVAEVLERCARAARDAGGLVHINHPNFRWSLNDEDLDAVSGVHHFEIYNGHPMVNNLGGGGAPSTEQMWDRLLSRGRLYYGVATDDMHHLKKLDRHHANPGRGWIVVRAAQLSSQAILASLAAGDFYASTGVELDEITTSAHTLSLRIRPHGDERFRTEFIGNNGKLLKEDSSQTPSYTLDEGDRYVRARVVSSHGTQAWTQPLFAKTP